MTQPLEDVPACDINLFRTLARTVDYEVHPGFADDPRPLLIDPNGPTLSYSEVFHRAACFASALTSRGVREGDRVVAQVSKSPDAVALYLACQQVGAIQIPLNTAYTQAEVSFFIDDAEPALVITDSPEANSTAMAELCALANDAEPSPAITTRCGSDIAMMLYTSGTTGRSKGAMLSHQCIAANGYGLAQCWEFGPQDTLLHVLPIFHVHGLFIAIHPVMVTGGSMYFPNRFDSDQIVDLLPDCTAMMGVPTHYSRLLENSRFDAKVCQSMRLFTSGSAPMIEQLHTEFEARSGHRVVERYGMTETGIITSNPFDGDRVEGTVGFSLPSTEVRVRVGDVRDAEPGEAGIVEMRGPGCMEGYWKQPEATAAETRPGGWFVTGDVGHLDSHGRLTLEGRAGDMIISGGLNIYPKEVELVIDAVDGVVESAVVASPHPDFGEAVVAVVVGSPDPSSLQSALDSHLARFKHPRLVDFVEALPRNAMGKVQKNLLRGKYTNTFAK